MTKKNSATRGIRFSLMLAVVAAYGLASTAVAEIFVLRENDGTAYANTGKDAVPVFIDRFTDLGVAVGTPIALPTTDPDGAGGQNPLTLAPESTSLGHLSRSTDGQYLLLGGYGSPVGTANVRVVPSTTTPRVIGRVRISDGAVDTSTTTGDAYSGAGTATNGDLRSVVSTDGTKFWTFGTGNAVGTSGARFVASLGASTSTQLSASPANPTNVRVGRIVNGQLFESASTTVGSGFVGISSIGTGLPETAGQTTTLRVKTGNAAADSSPYSFWFKDASTVYVADDLASSAGGGIEKWVTDGKVPGDYNSNGVVDAADYVLWRDQDGQPAPANFSADGDGSGTVDTLDYTWWATRFGNDTPVWTLAYTINTGLAANEGIRGLDGTIVAGNAVLYATTGTAGFAMNEFLNPNKLVTVIDTGAASAFVTLEDSAANTFFRGVVYVPPVVGASLAGVVPEPTSAVLLLFGLAALGLRRRTAR